MGSHSGFYKGDAKKKKQSTLEKKAQKQINTTSWAPPVVDIIKKGKKDW